MEDNDLYNDGILFGLEACFSILDMLPETDLIIELEEILHRQLSISMKVGTNEILYKSEIINHMNECSRTLSKLNEMRK